jgi:DNA-binding NarL/FixJ family response regulator
VILAEDQVLLREGLVGLFHDGGHEVLASRGSCEGIEELVETEQPDLVVLDIRLPPTYTDEGTQAASRIKAASPHTGVLLLSQHVDSTHTVDLVQLGGFGYLLKDRVLDVADFLSAAERVARGGSALDPYVVAALLSRTAGRTRLAALTEREQDVLRLMAQGLTNTGIAKRLSLSERTVEAHIRRLLTKLDIDHTKDANRRVLAVLMHLGMRTGPARPES